MFKITTKLINTLQKALNNSIDENRFLRKEKMRLEKRLKEEFIMTLNQIQDIQAMNNKEKDKLINNIIDNKRSEYVNKIIELDYSLKQSSSK